MKILFNLMTTLEIPDADYFAPKEYLEKEIVREFENMGLVAHGLEVTNYCVPAVKEDADEAGNCSEFPNNSADEWCTTCKEYDADNHNCPRFNRVIRKTVEEIRQNQIPEYSAWFRISETLVDESKGHITAEQAVEKIRDYLKRMEKPERKKGKWIDITKTGGDSVWKCSECGSLNLEDTYFCPDCGCNMRGEQDEID